MKLGQNICLDKILDEFENRSVGQILKKPCVRSRGHVFSLIIMKLGQTLCLDKISNKFENGSCLFEN